MSKEIRLGVPSTADANRAVGKEKGFNTATAVVATAVAMVVPPKPSSFTALAASRPGIVKFGW
ncbi:hypothetical protein D9M73_274610 [compost metagenome]